MTSRSDQVISPRAARRPRKVGLERAVLFSTMLVESVWLVLLTYVFLRVAS
jgi:hypothetical protein